MRGFREARKVFEAERGERLDDDELMAMLLARALEGAPAEKATKPRYQVAVTVCHVCKQGWQNGAGREIAISAADVECATCDAEVISIGKPGRPSRTIPVATKRAVLARDHHKCTVPGCRSTQNLDAHHLVHWEHGGTHDMENLTTLCDGHHKAHHRGQLEIGGRAPEIDVRWIAEVPRVGEPEVVEQARSVLRNLGFTRAQAAVAVERAVASVGNVALEPLVRAALQETR